MTFTEQSSSNLKVPKLNEREFSKDEILLQLWTGIFFNGDRMMSLKQLLLVTN